MRSAKRIRGQGIAPDWSPDGRRFVFVLRGELWTEAVDGTSTGGGSRWRQGPTPAPSGRPTARKSRSCPVRAAQPPSTACGASMPTARTGAC